MGFVATTEGIKGEDVRDLMVMAVEHRFGQINRLPETIEWLTDNGSGYIAHDTRRFARDMGNLAPPLSRALSQMEWPRHSCAR
jgi:putative transposase